MDSVNETLDDSSVDMDSVNEKLDDMLQIDAEEDKVPAPLEVDGSAPLPEVVAAPAAPAAPRSPMAQRPPHWHEVEIHQHFERVDPNAPSSSTLRPLVVSSIVPGQDAFKCLRCKLVCSTLETLRMHFMRAPFQEPCGHLGDRDLLKFGTYVKEEVPHGEELNVPRAAVPGSKRAREMKVGSKEEVESRPRLKLTRLKQKGKMRADVTMEKERRVVPDVRTVVLCPLCLREFPNSKELRTHVAETLHAGYEAIKCFMCSTLFCAKSEFARRLHMTCPGCGFLDFLR